ncbi:MAG: hypothetical protein WAW92_01070 [Minisyncoccia bacterium]
MKQKVLEINREKTMFWMLLGTLFLAIGFYMYFINVTIHNTVARQNLESEGSSLALSIGNKEFEYISRRNNITLALAHELGYKNVKGIAYVNASGGKVVAVAR